MKQRTLVYCLVGSIALNVFLLGATSVHLVSGPSPDERAFRGPRDNPPGAALEDVTGRRFLRALVRAAGGPKDPRVKELWSGHRQHLRAIRKDIVDTHAGVLDALERDPFERQRLGQALDKALAARRRADELAAEGALQLVDKLSSAERQQVCREMRQSPRGRKDRDD